MSLSTQERARHARYAETNDFVRCLCGLPPSKQFPVVSEADWIAADIANNIGKTERNQADALKLQIKDGRESWT